MLSDDHCVILFGVYTNNNEYVEGAQRIRITCDMNHETEIYSADIRRAANAYFSPDGRYILWVLRDSTRGAGALGSGGGLGVNDPVAGSVAGGLGIFALIAVPAAGAGEHGIAHRRTGGGGGFYIVIVAQRLLNHGPTFCAKLGISAGSRLGGNMAAGGIALQTVSAAAHTAVPRHALTGARAPGDGGAIVPAMAQCAGVVRDEAGAAAVADVGDMPARFAGGLADHNALPCVAQRRHIVPPDPTSGAAWPVPRTGRTAPPQWKQR